MVAKATQGVIMKMAQPPAMTAKFRQVAADAAPLAARPHGTGFIMELLPAHRVKELLNPEPGVCHDWQVPAVSGQLP